MPRRPSAISRHIVMQTDVLWCYYSMHRFVLQVFHKIRMIFVQYSNRFVSFYSCICMVKKYGCKYVIYDSIQVKKPQAKYALTFFYCFLHRPKNKLFSKYVPKQKSSVPIKRYTATFLLNSFTIDSVFQQKTFITKFALQQRVSNRNETLRQIRFCTSNTIGILAGCATNSPSVKQRCMGI